LGPPNGFSIESAVFPQYPLVIARQTDQQNDNGTRHVRTGPAAYAITATRPNNNFHIVKILGNAVAVMALGSLTVRVIILSNNIAGGMLKSKTKYYKTIEQHGFIINTETTRNSWQHLACSPLGIVVSPPSKQ